MVSEDPRAHLYSWAEGIDTKDIVGFFLFLGGCILVPLSGPKSAWAQGKAEVVAVG